MTYTHNGYTIVERKGRRVKLHRLVIENKLGHPIPEGYIVHHKDHDKKNFSEENLELLSIEEHASLHSAQRTGQRSNFIPSNKLSSDTIKRIISLHDQGNNYSQIGRILGISDFTARNYILHSLSGASPTDEDRQTRDRRLHGIRRSTQIRNNPGSDRGWSLRPPEITRDTEAVTLPQHSGA